ncbi:MAG TPA: alpha/beta fold hydrolase [Thermoanaerobaculia bacterium]|nr:alpha/beta fold hydrolase [Thermoanaerobaculia bacterium]
MTWLLLLLLAAPLHFAHLGDFTLENGQVIHDCRIGYRTYGVLAADKSNVIVVTTWFGGTTEGLEAWIGPGKLYDSSKYFVVAIDAFGDGVSSSAANFTMRDLVRSQHTLLTRELKLDHVFAVSGLSMGGMQTFQWVVSYPYFMTKAVPIVGSPKLTAYDLLLWKTELSLIDSPMGMKAAADINEMHLHTPAWIASHVKDVDALMKMHEEAVGKLDVSDYASQLRAMIGHDVGSVENVRAKMLIVVAAQDHMVNPLTAIEFARATKSELITLTSDCGHLATVCETERLTHEVARFLATP